MLQTRRQKLRGKSLTLRLARGMRNLQLPGAGIVEGIGMRFENARLQFEQRIEAFKKGAPATQPSVRLDDSSNRTQARNLQAGRISPDPLEIQLIGFDR